ncbi:MAG TPA: T9SS type A sorting domain-containing protein [Ignavibacteriaceae bacterium]|nr:T9SS type A sorting domain-containing protein [Ignavibacteriaceae bacterium]
MNYKSLFIAALFLGSLSAQNFSPNISSYNPNSFYASSNDTLKLLAVMVEFQTDDDQTTVGDGKFNSIYTSTFATDTSILDPMPHNKEYFEAHLEFARNYYKKISNGKLLVDYYILPSVITVSKTIKNYSPPMKSTDFTPMAELVKEVWELAAASNAGFDFSSYSLFTIFHAGVGRDISLPGSLGNERDIPSLYLSLNSLKEFLGETFDGIPVNNNFKITNSMILPQTNNRELSSYGNKYLFEVTINGLIAANIASHLGVPDLFNTNTGLSAIGRMGLMDGQSIFAYNGAFPPEPSAWEKLFLSDKLGWNLPLPQLSPGSYTVSLVTKEAASAIDTVFLKIPINPNEYFLLENRNRDTNKDGCYVTIWNNGNRYKKFFPKDSTGFYSYDTEVLQGVVIDVDEFDWATPGNGILIWHIDDAVINEKLAANKINTDKSHRGVNLEEADGIQDIGEEFTTIFGDVVIGEGSEEDFWFSSNEATIYKKNGNSFSLTTRPNTKSNFGANSLISFSDFSDSANVMTFKISWGDSVVKPLLYKHLPLTSTNNSVFVSTGQNDYSYLVKSGNMLNKYDKTGSFVYSLPVFSKFNPSILFSSSIEFIAGVIDSTLNVRMDDGTSSFLASINTGSGITTQPVFVNPPTEQNSIIFGTDDGKLKFYSTGFLPSGNPVLQKVDSTLNGWIIRKIAAEHPFYAVIAEEPSAGGAIKNYKYYNSDGYSVSFSGILLDFALTKNSSGNYLGVVLLEGDKFLILKNNEIDNQFTAHSTSGVKSFSLADLKNDGENYIIFTSGYTIDAVNINGSRADNFPFEDPNRVEFTSKPVAADFEGDNKAEIIASTVDGRIFAIDGGTGKVINSFPVSIGTKINHSPFFFLEDKKVSLTAIDEKANLASWNIGLTEGKLIWNGEYGSVMNSNYLGTALSLNRQTNFFPVERAYNYPNPVYEGKTFIRYYVSEDSKINIKIFDLAGDYVAELNNEAYGGMDNETIWDVSGIQSGVYLARIEAVSNSGKTESTIIKIAVVK